ncbi:MAG: VWA domain-containing protein [Chloroflexota bacterium]
MGLLAPLALIGLISVPIIIAFYMLRLRRPEHTVSSTFLWQQLVRDVEANAPWQRLRRSLLLLLQLLLAVLLAVIVARPFSEHPAGLARDLVLVIDASASMSATDVFPDRLTAAKRLALEQMAEVPSDGRVSVIAAGDTARVVANEATDRGRITQAINSIEASTSASDLTDALKLANSLAKRARGAEIMVVTDDASSSVPNVTIEAPLHALTVGRERDNQAIAALAVRADPSGLKRTLFVSVANYSASTVGRSLQILADGTPVTARDLFLDPLTRANVVIDELPAGTSVVEARLTPVTGGDQPAGPPDYLPLDDAAWAIVPPDRLRRVLLVGPGNVYIQNAFSLLPNVELYGATAEQWPTTTGKDKFDLIVFDGFVPTDLPKKPVLAFAPPATSPLGVVTGTLTQFGMGQPAADDPLLRGVDLTRLHIAKTQQMELPAWARAVLPGSDGPLLYAGVRDALPTAVFAFDIRDSDLPLQVAWPIMVSNLAGELLGLNTAALDPLSPSSPIDIPISPDAQGVRVTLPDGTVEILPPGATGASTVTFVSTRQLGIYRAEVIPAPTPSGSPGATATPSPSPQASPSGGATPVGTTNEPLLFAVDLFSAEESNIRPGDGARLVALSANVPPTQVAAGTARDEFWPLVAVLALLFLMIEWLVYERDGARRLLNGIRNVNPLAGRRTARRGRAA